MGKNIVDKYMDNENLWLGGAYPFKCETLDLEFKTIALKKSLESYTDKENFHNFYASLIYARDGLDFTRSQNLLEIILIDTLKDNIEHYLAKYISCFTNCSTISKGTLVFGITDDTTEITGIPYFGPISSHLIDGYIRKVFSSFLQTKNTLKSLTDACDYKITKLGVDTDLLPNDIRKLYQIFQSSILKGNDASEQYRNEHSQWIQQIVRYKSKMSQVVNTTHFRRELAAYILKSIGKINRNTGDEKFPNSEYECLF